MCGMISKNVTINDRSYQWPAVPAIAICLDGCEPAYLDEAIKAGLMPALAKMKEKGTVKFAHSVIPSFTNPNNLSIATGRPPAIHGICGNYLYNPETGEEVMMNDPKFLRVPTIFQGFDDGRAICFSAEKADTTTVAEFGVDNASKTYDLAVPEVHSAELSEFVFAAGVQILRDFRPDIMYLTTTDYVQHKYAPGNPHANAFYEMFDKYLAELDASGAAIVVTADHGMKPKHHGDGSPNVVYVQYLLDDWLGKDSARVILPITDPYVVHHGALGAFATAYLPEGADYQNIMDRLREQEGITVVLDREEACARFELPEDRIGDIVIISGENKTIGTSEDRHNLAALNEPLRSMVG